MRGQGSNGSLVLFNGRRMASTNGGFGADINTIPTEVLQSVEVLKDGASATYGAGAVGGVMNFTTRRDIDAPQVGFETTIYDGSSSYKADFLTGWVGDASNFLISFSHFHEDPLEATERSFATLPYNINPAGYSNTAVGPARFQITGQPFYTAPGTAAGTGFALGTGINDYRGGAATTYAGVTAQGRADCQSVGGYIYGDVDPTGTDATTSKTLCGFNENLLNQLVSDQTLDRVYSEFNANLSDTMEFHIDGIYSKSVTIAVVPPSPNASASAIASQVGAYAVPRNVQYYVPGATAGTWAVGGTTANPFIPDFLARTGATMGAGSAVVMPLSSWRPFMYGGNPAYKDDGRERQTYDRERFMINAGLKGEFQTEGLLKFLNGITYDYAIQYNQYKDDRIVPAIFRSRVQNALLGYGGASCLAQDRVATDYSSPEAYSRTVGIQSDTLPGTNGCQFFNPFVSSFQSSIATGQANPQYGGLGFTNSRALAEWMTQEDRNSEQNTEAVTFDALWTGTIPESIFALPGGEIGWAAGAQLRANELRAAYWSDSNNEERMISQTCPWPDLGNITIAGLNQNLGASPTQNQLGCLSGHTGVYLAGGVPTTTNATPPDMQDSQTVAYFGEIQLPVLDNLNLSASLRNESYNNDKISGTIWSVAGKYSITDNLYVRASYGTNFRAEGALDLTPGSVTQGVTTGAVSTVFGTGFNVATRTTVDNNLGLEDDKTANLGVGVDFDIGEGRLRASVDWFNIEVEGAFGTTSLTTIVNNVFTSNIGSANAVADCSARLRQFVVFNNGNTCTQGVTTAVNLRDGGLIDLVSLNASGFLTNGYDYSIDYSQPVFDGRFGVNLTATQNTVYKFKGYDVNGVEFSPDQNILGGTNTLNGLGASPSQKWRGNLSLRWANDQHSFNVRANYLSGSDDNRALTLYAPVVNNTGTATDVISGYGRYAKEYLDYDFNYIWTAPFWEEITFRASVLNIADKAPPPAQGSAGYSTGAGDPRGRRIEFGINKKF
jgi:outer membrane receptor protein involved in Fe transport